MLLIPVIYLFYGSMIWYKADGDMDNQLGQATMMQSLMILLPYVSSLIVLETVLEYTKRDLNLDF